MLALLISLAFGCSCEIGSTVFADGMAPVGTNASVLVMHAGEAPPEDGKVWLQLQDDAEATFELVAEGPAYSDGYGVVQRYRPIEFLPANARLVPIQAGGLILTGPDKVGCRARFTRADGGLQTSL